MKKVYICSAMRTPIGSFGGVFANIEAPRLGAMTITAMLNKINIQANQIDEVLMGNVCSANLGQAPARQVAILAGLPNTVPCTTINKVCASGMKAIMLGAQSIMLGINKVMIVGGIENMSIIPHYLSRHRWGNRLGNTTLIDGLMKDGLSDAYTEKPMGVFADKTAEVHNVSREEQDAFAIASYKKVAQTSEQGLFKDEIIPVEIKNRKETIEVNEDEEYKNIIFEKIPKLKPAFTKEGSVTPANASTISDGAAILIIASEDFVKDKNLHPIAEIVACSDAAHEPEWFTTAPIKATEKVLEKAQLSLNDIDFFEVNEAFSVVPLVFAKQLKISQSKINVFGGAIALGHPLGASGARILVTLCNVLNQKKGTYGLATICNGGGGASSMIIKRVE